MSQPPSQQPRRSSGRPSGHANGEILTPVRKAPSLTSINGFGFKLYGKSDHDPATGSFMTTHYFIGLFIPLFPIARYRVVSPGYGQYQFLGKGRLRGIDKLHMAVFAALVLYAIKTAGLK
jgi:hypothetical protein